MQLYRPLECLIFISSKIPKNVSRLLRNVVQCELCDPNAHGHTTLFVMSCSNKPRYNEHNKTDVLFVKLEHQDVYHYSVMNHTWHKFETVYEKHMQN